MLAAEIDGLALADGVVAALFTPDRGVEAPESKPKPRVLRGVRLLAMYDRGVLLSFLKARGVRVFRDRPCARPRASMTDCVEVVERIEMFDCAEASE